MIHRKASSCDGKSDRKKKAAAAKQDAEKSTAKQKTAKKRRFPYRKLSDIERDIADREATVRRLQGELSDPDVLRNGPQVRQIKSQLEAEAVALKDLYWHWEEAAELNW